MIFSYLLNMQSHPSWVCGLKHGVVYSAVAYLCVTPFVGVWIETSTAFTLSPAPLSHPSWVCGLKLLNTPWQLSRCASHPSWVCGLKRINITRRSHGIMSHPSWVCGLKQHFTGLTLIGNPGHTLRGCVD